MTEVLYFFMQDYLQDDLGSRTSPCTTDVRRQRGDRQSEVNY